jgi:hypothetical protein
MIVANTHFNIVDDWASFEATPAYDHENVVAVGLYTSDFLSEGEIPVAMDNAATLADFLAHEGAVLGDATRKLWQRMAGWNRDQMLDAGAMMYAGVAKDLFHVAGIYDQTDWFTIDPRAQRVKPLLNDEYARDFLAELLGHISLPAQQGSPYSMNKWADGAGDMWSPVPYAVLAGAPFTRTSGGSRPGATALVSKQGKWLTTRGKLSLDEYNHAARAFTPAVCAERYRFLDDAWLRDHPASVEADRLYKLDQKASRQLAERGSGVTRADLDRLRAASGAEIARMNETAFLALHGLAIKKSATAAAVAHLMRLSTSEVEAALTAAVAAGHAVAAQERYVVSSSGRDVLAMEYPPRFAAVRADSAMRAAYARFEVINRQLLVLMTRWQTVEVSGAALPNDHADADYDAKIIDALGDLHERAIPILNAIAAAVTRLAVYSELLHAAYDRVLDGDTDYVSGARVASYHTVWFELHEELLRLLGRARDA